MKRLKKRKNRKIFFLTVLLTVAIIVLAGTRCQYCTKQVIMKYEVGSRKLLVIDETPGIHGDEFSLFCSDEVFEEVKVSKAYELYYIMSLFLQG